MREFARAGRAGPALASASVLAFALLLPSSARAQTPTELGPALFGGLHYRMAGPTRGGRVTAVAGHPDRPGTFYMGASGGGVWKTTDFGQSWLPLADDALETGSVGAITVAPSDPRVVWVGTGSEAIRSNVIPGRGVYRSDDGGASWRFVGLREAGQIGAVVVDPRDPDEAWVAALGNPFGRSDTRGVYRTRDGGRTWDRVLFTSDSVGAVDLEMHPTDPDVLYAAMWRGERKPWTIVSGMAESGREDGIWRSIDGGDHWEYVPLELPSGLIGKIDFAVSAAAPDRVYALVETKEPDEGLYRSDDRGRTWRLVSAHEPLMDRPFYYTNVDADPTDADVVYVSATQFWKSIDGGASWERRPTAHGDNHDLWIDPGDPRVMVQSNDGGASVTRDGGETWSTQYNQATAELYSVDLDDRFPRWMYSGQQDNTTIMVPSDRPTESSLSGPQGFWHEVGGCETGPAVPEPGDPDIVFSNCKGRFGRFSQITGQEQQYYVGAANLYGTNPADLQYRFQRVAPIEISPHDPEVVYHGSQYVHRTTDGGVTWERISPDLTAFRPERQVESGEPITRDITGEEHYSVIYALEESPVRAGVIWTGANDGPVYLTTDGGASWTDVTPPDMPPEGRIQAIDPSPHDPARAYVAGYRTLLGDFRPFIYETEDYGRSWRLLTPGDNGIPLDQPTRVVREDPDRPRLLYAGTEFGMYLSFDDGGHWIPFQLDLPATPVTDLKVVDRNLYVSTMGRGFWVLDDLAVLHQAMDGFDPGSVQLFQPRAAYRTRGGSSFFGFGDTSPVRPEYTRPGVDVDYWVPRGFSGELSLAVTDASGDTLRSYRGDPPLDTAQGAHRLVWDFSAGSGAPLVPPGRYTIRLEAGDRRIERSVDVRIDPRVARDGTTVADLKEQYALSMEVRATMNEAARLDRRIRARLEAAGAPARAALEALRARMEDETRGSYPQPMLLNQLRYLYAMLQRADQKPGRDAYTRLEELRARLGDIAAAFEELQGGGQR